MSKPLTMNLQLFADPQAETEPKPNQEPPKEDEPKWATKIMEKLNQLAPSQTTPAGPVEVPVPPAPKPKPEEETKPQVSIWGTLSRLW